MCCHGSRIDRTFDASAKERSQTLHAPTVLRTRSSATLKCVATCILGLTISSCAAYNPYVSSSATATDQTECRASAPNSTALRYACQKRAEVESDRSQLVETQNGVASAIFPLAGLVGYRVSRSASHAATAALAATGIAGYGLSAYLIQQSRFALYDRAESALTCAIGLYKTSAARLAVPFQEAKYQVTRNQLKGLISTLGKPKFRPLLLIIQPQVLAYKRQLAYGPETIRLIESSSLLDAQLSNATDRIISELNTALTNTIQPITSVAQPLSALRNGVPAPASTAHVTLSPTKQNKLKTYLRTQSNAYAAILYADLNNAYAAYKRAQSSYLSALSEKRSGTSVDFSKCTVGVYIPSTKATSIPLAVDKNNITLSKQITSAFVHISGGKPPYSFGFLPKPKVAAPKYSFQTVGLAYILVFTKAAAKSAKLNGLVSDSGGSVVSIAVTVKE